MFVTLFMKMCLLRDSQRKIRQSQAGHNMAWKRCNLPAMWWRQIPTEL